MQKTKNNIIVEWFMIISSVHFYKYKWILKMFVNHSIIILFIGICIKMAKNIHFYPPFHHF